MHGRSLPPLVVDPLKSELLDDAVWDFSQQWTGDDRSGASVHVYGDPLLSETVAGRGLFLYGSDLLMFRGMGRN